MQLSNNDARAAVNTLRTVDTIYDLYNKQVMMGTSIYDGKEKYEVKVCTVDQI